MRIVAGEFGGRALLSPVSRNIRPTADRVRESLFSTLTSSYSDSLRDARVLDLFAGTGALGLEALSRGAGFCLFVEISAEARTLVQRNIENLNLQARTEVLPANATRLSSISTREPFNLVFADPPYGRELAERAMTRLVRGGWLHSGAIIIIEDQAGTPALVLPSCQLLDERKSGNTKIRFLKYIPC